MTAYTGRDALEELEIEYEACARCPNLCTSRKQVVFGGGSSSAPILIVGEAPGENEDACGEVFVGDSGKLLMDLLAKAWPPDEDLTKIKQVGEDDTYFDLLREFLDQHVFWTNVCLCRPAENRTPTAQEVRSCLSRLHRTIYAIDPVVIIAVGKVAATAMVGKAVKVGDKHGSLFDATIASPITGGPVRYPMLAILHPSALLRLGDQALVKRRQGKTYETLVDLRECMALLQRLYTDVYKRPFPER